jgi:hypothetical protein
MEIMTPEEHETLQLKMRVIALQNLLDWLVDIERMRCGMTPEPARSLMLESIEKRLSKHAQEFSTLTLEGMHPAESDMRTALFQEAFDEVSKKIFKTISSGLSKDEIAHFDSLR